MKKTTLTKKHHGRYLPWAVGSAAFLGLTGTLWALSEVLENDSDGDGWIDTEEIIAGTDPADETDPWDSDGDGIADYLEFLDGTDPLDPNDPPRIRKSVLTYSVAAASDEVANISLESLKSGSQQNMRHNTAWFGKRLSYTFFRPTADSKWKALNGNEIEYWSTGYYDLLARNGSSGIAITVENVPSGKYTLKWKHMQRPDGGSTGYTVSVSGAATASKRFTAPKSNSEGEVREASLTFEVSERGTLVLSFDAGSSGTSGPLVGSIALCEALGVIKVDWNTDAGGQEFKVTQDSGAAFTGSDWESLRKRQANPVAFQSGSNLKLIPTFNNPESSPPTAIRAQVTLGNSTNTYTLPWTERGKGISIPAPVPAGTVGYFENVQVTWSVSHDSETWEDAGSSTHEIYFTRGTPLISLRQETLFHISCKQATGLSDPTAIVDAIYSEFTDLDVRRISDGKQMTYWGSSKAVNYRETSKLLLMGDGNCQAWSGFFRDLLYLHGIQATRISIFSTRALPEVIDFMGLPEPEWVLVSPWAFSLEEDSVEKTCIQAGYGWSGKMFNQIYTHTVVTPMQATLLPKTASPSSSIPGQGNESSPSYFNGHWITKVGGMYYDPSYGSSKCSSLLEYETIAFSGFMRHDGSKLSVKNAQELDTWEKESE